MVCERDGYVFLNGDTTIEQCAPASPIFLFYRHTVRLRDSSSSFLSCFLMPIVFVGYPSERSGYFIKNCTSSRCRQCMHNQCMVHCTFLFKALRYRLVSASIRFTVYSLVWLIFIFLLYVYPIWVSPQPFNSPSVQSSHIAILVCGGERGKEQRENDVMLLNVVGNKNSKSYG